MRLIKSSEDEVKDSFAFSSTTSLVSDLLPSIEDPPARRSNFSEVKLGLFELCPLSPWLC
jgi:hypothetical protein